MKILELFSIVGYITMALIFFPLMYLIKKREDKRDERKGRRK